MLSKKIAAVELLDPQATRDAKIRKVVPAYKVRMKLTGSDARLLRVAPDMETLLGGSEGLALYAKINSALADLQWKVTPPTAAGAPAKPEADLPRNAVDAKNVVQAAKADAAKLAKILSTAVQAGTISKAQADDTLKRLSDAIDAAAADAKGK